MYAKPIVGQELLFSFPEKAEKSYALFYNVFSDVIFYPRVLQYVVWGIENYPSACMPYTVVTALRSLKSEVREYISLPLTQFASTSLISAQDFHICTCMYFFG